MIIHILKKNLLFLLFLEIIYVVFTKPFGSINIHNFIHVPIMVWGQCILKWKIQFILGSTKPYGWFEFHGNHEIKAPTIIKGHKFPNWKPQKIHEIKTTKFKPQKNKWFFRNEVFHFFHVPKNSRFVILLVCCHWRIVLLENGKRLFWLLFLFRVSY